MRPNSFGVGSKHTNEASFTDSELFGYLANHWPRSWSCKLVQCCVHRVVVAERPVEASRKNIFENPKPFCRCPRFAESITKFITSIPCFTPVSTVGSKNSPSSGPLPVITCAPVSIASVTPRLRFGKSPHQEYTSRDIERCPTNASKLLGGFAAVPSRPSGSHVTAFTEFVKNGLQAEVESVRYGQLLHFTECLCQFGKSTSRKSLPRSINIDDGIASGFTESVTKDEIIDESQQSKLFFRRHACFGKRVKALFHV